MSSYKEVQKEWGKVLDKLERALENPNVPRRGADGLMKQWGAIMVSTSTRAFVDQRFGEFEWPPRYPGMEAPVINIAGTLEDWNSERANPKPVRFKDKPALVDEGSLGGLQSSITYAAGNSDVAVGTNKPYAQLHQDGGETYIRVSEAGYKRGKNWLFKDRIGTARKGREGYVRKLWPALSRRLLTQNVIRRPFIGVTDQAASDMIRATTEYFEREAGLGGGRMVAAV